MLHSLRVRLLLTMSLVVLAATSAAALFTSRTTQDQFQVYVQNDIARDQRIVSELLAEYKGDSNPESLQSLVDKLAGTSSERIVVADREGNIIADSGHTMVGEKLPLPQVPATLASSAGPAFGIVSSAPATFSVNMPVTGSMLTALYTNTSAATNIWAMPVTNTVNVSWAPVFIPLAGVPISGTSTMAGVTSSTGVTSGTGGTGGTGALLAQSTGLAPGMSFETTPGADLIVARLPDINGTPTEIGFLNSVNRQLLLAALAAGAVALLLTWLLSRRIVGPIEALTAAAGRMERGDLGSRVNVSSRDEIGKLAHAFNSMSTSMAQQEQLRRNMVTDIAHELRTPLSNIRGYLEAVRDGVVDANPALIGSLHEESLVLSRLVEDLQELQLAEAGQLRMEQQETSVAEITESVSRGLNQSAEAKGVTIQTEISPDLPGIQADPARIGQVLRNLLENAITHTPSGGVVKIEARDANGEVEVSIKDTGTGIAPDHLPHIFDRFYRADGSRARTTGGAGLGLAIVKQLVQLHGGHVWAESTLGEGATFYFTVPVAVPIAVPLAGIRT